MTLPECWGLLHSPCERSSSHRWLQTPSGITRVTDNTPARAVASSLHMRSHSRGWMPPGSPTRKMPWWQEGGGSTWTELDGQWNMPEPHHPLPMPVGFPVSYFPLLKGKVFSANSQSGEFDSGKRWVECGFLALDPWYRAVHGFREGLTLIEPGCSQATSRHREDTNQIEASFSLLFLGFIFQQVFSYLGRTERANALESVRLALCILQLSVPLQVLLELCLLGLKWLPLRAWKGRVSVLGIYLWLSWPASWAFTLIHLFSSFHTPTWVHTHMGVSTHSHYMSTHSTKYTLH